MWIIGEALNQAIRQNWLVLRITVGVAGDKERMQPVRLNAIHAQTILGDPGQAATMSKTYFEKTAEAAPESITDTMRQSKTMLILSLLLCNASWLGTGRSA